MFVYEAGPCGSWLYRSLTRKGLSCFVGRFLQHVLPQGFSKVRHYGLFSPSRLLLLAQARAHLIAASASPPPARVPIDPAPLPAPANPASRRCPVCGIGVLHLVETLPPCGRSP